MLEQPTYFQSESESTCRPGNLVDYLCLHVNESKELGIEPLWDSVLSGLASMWPTDGGRTIVSSTDAKSGDSSANPPTNLGDVWTHSCLKGETSSSRLIPFHKLSQWITYSLVEPLEQHLGWTVTGLDQMTGLPEYRNGGLFLDEQVLVLKDPRVLTDQKAFHPSEELIVEWRALTIVLLDEVYALWKTKHHVTSIEFPMVKLLEAGTWKAGRKVAKSLRPATGSPPIQIVSDGTIF